MFTHAFKMGLIALGLLFSPVSYAQNTCESDADCEDGETCDSDGVCVRTKKIEDEDLLGSRKKRETQTPRLEKPASSPIRLVASVGFVGGGSLLMLRGVMLRGELEESIRVGYTSQLEFEDWWEEEKFRVNSHLALGYALLGTGTILGFMRNQSSTGTDMALTWRGVW